jgi:hypothetical protein
MALWGLGMGLPLALAPLALETVTDPFDPASHGPVVAGRYTVAPVMAIGYLGMAIILLRGRMAIRRLEEAVGVPLFARTTREVRLTAAGEAFAQHARRAVKEIEHGRTSPSRPVAARPVGSRSGWWPEPLPVSRRRSSAPTAIGSRRSRCGSSRRTSGTALPDSAAAAATSRWSAADQ